MKNIKKLLCIISLVLCTVSMLNSMDRQHHVKLSYKNNLLSWRQTTAFLEAKLLKDMILDDENEYNSEEITIDEIVGNKDQKEFFKNNILDIINIFPKKSYKDLGAWNEDYKIMLHDEINKIVTKEDGKESEKIMGLIQCAYYIDSPVLADLIKFALRYELIDQNILDSTDYTPESLEYVKRCYSPSYRDAPLSIYDCNIDILKKVLPLENIEYWIDKNSKNSDYQNIVNIIKSKHYKNNEKKDLSWFRQNWKRAVLWSHIKKYQCPYDSGHFPQVRLQHKLRLITVVHDSLNLTNEQLERFDANIKYNNYRDLKFGLLMIPGFFLDIALPILLKKYFSYSCGQILTMYGIKQVAGIFIGLIGEKLLYGPRMSINEWYCASGITGYMLSPLIQLFYLKDVLERLTRSPRSYWDLDNGGYAPKFESTIEKGTWFDKQEFTLKKNILEKVQNKMLKEMEIIKNEYALKK